MNQGVSGELCEVGGATDRAKKGETDRPAVSTRRIALNSSAVLGSYVLNTLLSVVVSIIIVRHLGRAEYGVMTLVVSYLSLFQMLGSMGMDTVLIREVARQPDRASFLVGGALGLRWILCGSTMLLACALSPLVGAGRETTLLIMLYSATLLSSNSALYLVIFNAELRQHIPNLALAVWSITYSAVRIAMVFLGAGVAEFLTADVLGGAVALVLCRWVSRRYAGFRPAIRIDISLWKWVLREGWPIAVAGWLIGLHARIDQLMLFRWAGAQEVGVYGVAVRVSEIWGVVPTVLMASLFPVLSRLAVENQGRLDQGVQFAYRYLYVVICPVAVLLGLYGRELVTVLFGSGFADAASPLTLLAGGEVFAFANSVTYNVLFSRDLPRQGAAIAGVSLGMNAVLNLWWIPLWGATGAAAASLVSYGFVSVNGLFVREVRSVAIMAMKTLVKPACAGLVALAVLKTISVGPFMGVPLGLALYTAALVGCGGVDGADVRLVRRAVVRS